MQPRPIVTATPYAIDDRGGVWLRPRRAAHSLKASLAAMAPAHGDAGSGRAGPAPPIVITAVHTLAHCAIQIERRRFRQLSGIRTSWQWHGNCSSHLQPMKNIDLNQLETTTGGCAPLPCCPPPCGPACMPPAPSPAAAWRWAARAQYRAAVAPYRAAAAYYGYGGWTPAARWWR
jgi:hypothetical protein